MSATAPRILPRILPRLFFRPNLTRRPLAQRFFTTAPSGPPNPTLSARLKHLSKEYGYSALGVYLAISALDFPLCFLGVRMVGSERIGEYEDATVSHLRKWYGATRATIPALPVWKEKSDELLEEQREQREGVKASKYTPPPTELPVRALKIVPCRYMDGAGARICHSQELYIRAGAADGGCYAQGGEGAERVGLGYWQEGRSGEGGGEGGGCSEEGPRGAEVSLRRILVKYAPMGQVGGPV